MTCYRHSATCQSELAWFGIPTFSSYILGLEVGFVLISNLGSVSCNDMVYRHCWRCFIIMMTKMAKVIEMFSLPRSQASPSSWSSSPTTRGRSRSSCAASWWTTSLTCCTIAWTCSPTTTCATISSSCLHQVGARDLFMMSSFQGFYRPCEVADFALVRVPCLLKCAFLGKKSGDPVGQRWACSLTIRWPEFDPEHARLEFRMMDWLVS